MKLLRSIGLTALLAFTFAACKKSDNNSPGSFTYESNTYSLNNAYFIFDSTDVSGELFLSSADYTNMVNGSKFNAFIAELPDTLQAGTFTLKDPTDPSFDKTKNFSAAAAGIGVTVNSADPAGFVNGTITVTQKSSTGFSISYEMLDIDNKTLKGSYSGTVTFL